MTAAADNVSRVLADFAKKLGATDNQIKDAMHTSVDIYDVQMDFNFSCATCLGMGVVDQSLGAPATVIIDRFVPCPDCNQPKPIPDWIQVHSGR
jgi:hypothetical protein